MSGIDKVSNILMNEDANLKYVSRDLEKVFEELGDLIKHHVQYQRPRLELLDAYSKGHNVGIHSRKGRTNKNRVDNREPNPYAKYISEFVQGYIAGIPVKVGADDDKLKGIVDSVDEENDIAQLNSEVVLDLSKYGRAYELVFYKENVGDRTVLLDVLNTFLVYDDSVSSEEICGVHYRLTGDRGNIGGLDNKVGVEVTVYSSDYVYVLRETSLNDFDVVIDEERSRPHGHREVPIIGYGVDRSRQGDYEAIIPNIDSYDSAKSDLANFMSDLNEAMLVINGDTDGLDWEKVDEGLRDSLVLELNGGSDANGKRKDIEAKYLERHYDVAGTDSYMNRIKSDIHKFSHVPDMSDESFGNNITGIGMRYKLVGLDQLAGKKKRAMEKGFNKRYRLFVNSKEFTEEVVGIENTKLHYKWTVNIPENIADELKSFVDSGGELSQESLLSTLSFINSPEDEKRRILAEKIGVPVEELAKVSANKLYYVMSLLKGNSKVNEEGSAVVEDVNSNPVVSTSTEREEGLSKLKAILGEGEV